MKLYYYAQELINITEYITKRGTVSTHCCDGNSVYSIIDLSDAVKGMYITILLS